jgi:hypothetical protein
VKAGQRVYRPLRGVPRLCSGDPAAGTAIVSDVYEVRHPDFCRRSCNADGADKQVHPILLRGEDVFDPGADFRICRALRWPGSLRDGRRAPSRSLCIFSSSATAANRSPPSSRRATLSMNSVENARIACCDMKPPNRPCHSNRLSHFRGAAHRRGPPWPGRRRALKNSSGWSAASSSTWIFFAKRCDLRTRIRGKPRRLARTTLCAHQ